MRRRLLETARQTSASSRRAACAQVPVRAFASSASSYAARRGTKKSSQEHRYNYTANPFDTAPDPDHEQYRRVTAKELALRSQPPRRAKMLARDFIDDALYNPHYGYFSTQATIFDPDDAAPAETSTRGQSVGFNFHGLRNSTELDNEIARRYLAYEQKLDASGSTSTARQLWHTPTELFKPWYGRAVARFLVAEYKLNLFPYEDLVIYEIGAGNGTLMADILDYIAECEPEVYERTQYRIVEISERLQTVQKGKLVGGDGKAASKDAAVERGHADRVHVTHESIFDWSRVVAEPCFFLAFEVLDNFAHDIIRYTTDDNVPLQCVVSIDPSGDFTELYEPITDPWIARYLQLRSRLPPNRAHNRPRILDSMLRSSPLMRKLYSAIPFAPNLTEREFLPTKQLMLLEVLREKFPAHRLLMSDFATLPDAIPGLNAPVVQTRYNGETVPCTTYLVQQGFFDIFFPTDFGVLSDLYPLVMSPKVAAATSAGSSNLSSSAAPRLGWDFFSPHSRRSAQSSLGDFDLQSLRKGGRAPRPVSSLTVASHAEFLSRWGEFEMTRVQDGSNPMLEYFANAKFVF